MSFSWILIALPLAVLLYFGWVIAWQKPMPHAMSLAPANPAPSRAWSKLLQPKRTVKWISSTELGTMTGSFEGVIVVDLLSRDNSRPHPLPEASHLHIKPDEFCDVLKWLPASSCLVLIGPADECRSMIRTGSEVAGYAPIFVIANG